MSNYAATKLEIQLKMKALKEEMKALGESFFKEESKKIFDDFPTLESFSWNQYTPYFNDGDACVFGVNDYFNLSFTDGSSEEYVDAWSVKYESNKEDSDYNPNVTVELVDRISNIVQGPDEDVMKSLFGDHVEVELRRDGTINVDDYQHD